jgi:hypothetical protein
MAVRVDMLRAYLRQTLDGSISQGDLTRFVQFARIVTASYLGTFRASAVVLCEKLGISSTDLAYDCVADMFARDEKGLLFTSKASSARSTSILRRKKSEEIFIAVGMSRQTANYGDRVPMEIPFFLVKQYELLRLNEVSCLDAIEVHAARQIRAVELDFVIPSTLLPIHKRSHKLA